MSPKFAEEFGPSSGVTPAMAGIQAFLKLLNSGSMACELARNDVGLVSEFCDTAIEMQHFIVKLNSWLQTKSN
jgi:hypothetical protein